MTIVSDLQGGATDALSYGQQVRFKYFTIGYGAGSYYDDDASYSQSGADLWTSGLVMPITNTQGSEDAVLIEQGKLLSNDSKLYVGGDINTDGVIKIGLGSPVEYEYSVVGQGITNWKVNNTDIIKKIYIRRLTTGSFIGES